MTVVSDRLVDLVDDLRKLPDECEWAELKVGNSDPDVIGKRLSALSNGARLMDKQKGYLVYGVADKTREVVGTKFKGGTEKVKGQQLQYWLSKELDPCPDIQYSEVDHTGKRVVIIEIDPAIGVPTKFKSTAYIRIGEATPKLSDHREKEQALWRKLQTYSWEKAPAATYLSGDRVLDLIDADQCRVLLKESKPRDNNDALTFLRDNKLIIPDVGTNWNITNKCAILFAKRMADFPSLDRRQIRLIQYGNEGRVNAIKEVPIPAGYALSFEWLVDTVVEMMSREDIGTLRLKRALVPRPAIREAIANAMIHQDMLVTTSVPMIEVFPDRVEIRNPGAPLIEPSRFINAPPQSRNEDIASLQGCIEGPLYQAG